MAKLIRIFALGLALLASGIWLATGAHRGWTRTSVPKNTVDEVTGIESVTYENRFVAGVDFLGASWLGAGALTGLSFFFRKEQNADKCNCNHCI